VRWDVGALWQVDARAGVLRCAAIWRRPGVEVPEFEAATRTAAFAPGVGIPGRVWAQGEPIWIPDAVRDPDLLRAPVAAREGLHGAFALPVVSRGTVLGVLEFFSREIEQPDADLVTMLLGIGSQHLRKIPVNEEYTIDLEALKQSIAADRAAGYRPICIIGSAGTVNTGAIDDLNALADICREQDLWFHVDGAIGAVAELAENIRPLLAGIERADSIALDLHKWMHIPFEAGCAIVRSEKAQRNTFSLTPEYLAHETRGLAAGHLWFSDYGLQLSRQFRALKVWMSVKEHGLDRFGRMIARNVEQAHYFAGLVENDPTLERMAPVGMDIVCFRFNPGGMEDEALSALNKEILMQLHEQGIAAPSYTTLQGRYCLRIAIANHRSRQEDFELLAREVVRIGHELVAQFSP